MAAVSVVWTPRARRQLNQILEEKLRSGGRESVSKLAAQISVAVLNLQEFPRAGGMIPQYQNDSLRRLIVEPYLILYRFAKTQAGIFMMIDGRREVAQKLPKRPWNF